MSKFFKQFIILIITVLALTTVHVSFAQTPVSTDTLFGGDTGQTAESLAAETGLGLSDPRLIIARVINITLGFLGIIALSLIVYAGYMWMSAQGNDEQITKAKKILIGGVIGLVIILSAFGIAYFVLRALGGATGVSGGQACSQEGDIRLNCNTCGGQQVCTNGFWSVCSPLCVTDPNSNDFYIKRSYPNQTITTPVPRNAVVTLTFNQSVLAASVTDETFQLSYLDESGNVVAAIDGTPTVSGRVVEFSPDALCPDNNQPGCFDATTTKDKNRVRVSVSGGGLGSNDSAVLSVNDLSLSCSLSAQAGNPCEFDFAVGNYIDREKPRITELAFTDQQICTDSVKTVMVEATDDSFVRLMYLDVRGSGQSQEVEIIDIEEQDRDSTTYWIGTAEIDIAGLGNPNELIVRAIVTDADSNTAERVLRTDIRPAQCCNEIQDENETGLDCGGTSGCASCEELGPVIDWVSPLDADNVPNGAVGNFVTIGGRYFGAYNAAESKVYFSCLNGDSGSGCQTMGDGVWKEAVLPSSVNAECTDTWTSRSVIVAVPSRESETSGVATGPIKIVRADGVFDTTNNAIGADTANFEVNDIVRPGLCKINDGQTPTTPADKIPHREPLGNITLHGIQLGSAGTFENVLFGTNNATSSAVSGWTDKTIQSVTVPVLTPQRTTVAVQKNGQRSNSLYIQIDDTDKAPYITDIEPRVGHAGDYVTIRGGNFGNERGDNDNVLIGAAKAVFDFPSRCLTGVWQDNQIIFKIPPTVGSGAHDVTVSAGGFTDMIDDGFRVGDYCQNNPSVSCEIDGEQCKDVGGDCITSALPGLCKLEPDNGKIGTPVTLYGERFGNTKGTVRFYNQVPAGTIVSWSDDIVSQATVPLSTQSGPVRVVSDAGAASNPMNFRVGSCLDSGNSGLISTENPNPACTTGQVCCAGNTQLPGSCVADQKDCGSVEGSTYSQYYIEFSTAQTDVISCDGDTAVAQCQPNVDLCPPAYTCNTDCHCAPPAPPKVVEECNRNLASCSERLLPSPSPLTPLPSSDWKSDKTWTDDGTNLACVNAVITVRFDKLIDSSTLSVSGDSKTITLKKCSVARNNIANNQTWNTCNTEVALAANNPLTISDAQDQTAVILTPAVLEKDTWYEVRLTKDIKSVARLGGIALENDYIWHFQTKDSDEACGLSCLSVVPATYTINTKGGTKEYVASPQQKDNACVMLNGTSYTYDWDLKEVTSWTSAQPPAPVYAATQTNKAQRVTRSNQTFKDTEQALAETILNFPVHVIAKTNVGNASYSGYGALNIKFADFYVEEEYPLNQCVEVCTNAEVGARFSSAILHDNENEGTKTVNSNKVSLQKCGPTSTVNNCIAPTPIASQITVSPYLVASKRQNVYDGLRFGLGGALLDPDTWYQATVRGGATGLKSTEGKELVSTSTKQALGEGGYSWIFKTGLRACEADRILLRPAPAVATVVGERIAHSAEPVSETQQCRTNTPTILRTSMYNWQWSTDEETVAKLQNPLNTYTRSLGTPPQANTPRQDIITVGEGTITTLNASTCNLAEYGFAANTPGQTTQSHANIAVNDPSSAVQSKNVIGTSDFCLACGNTTDDQCRVMSGTGVLTPAYESYGVGANTCCYPRPQVRESMPADGASKVCRNAQLRVTFDRPMSTDSLTGNVVVAANYDSASCPQGTEYLLLADAGQAVPGGLFRVAQSVYATFERWLDGIAAFGPVRWAGEKIAALPAVQAFLKTNAAWAVDYQSRWCAISGTIEARNQNDQGIVTFAVNTLLKPNTRHVILIKGDDNLTDGNRQGVTSLAGVGLRGKDRSGSNITFCDTENNCKFNGQSFYGEVIDFTTLADTATNQGVCVGDRVVIDPPAWTFFANTNDTRDDTAGSNYDTIDTDNDKLFGAVVRSADGQDLASLPDTYSWTWNWQSGKPSLVSVAPNSNSEQAMASTTATVRGKTYLNARATIVSSIANVPGGTKDGQAPVNVFLCQNPWPTFNPAAPQLWPFKDNDYNFEMYYCRDKGGSATSDDLPALGGVQLGVPNNQAATPILREYLLTQGERSEVPEVLSATADSSMVTLGWTVTGADKYKIYYGTASRVYASSEIVEANDTSRCAGESCAQSVTGLQNGTTYYFSVTALKKVTVNTAAGVVVIDGIGYEESAFSNEVSATPQTPSGSLSQVINFTAQVANNGIALRWRQSPETDVSGYEICHSTRGDTGCDETYTVNGRTTTQYIWPVSINTNAPHYLWLYPLDLEKKKGPPSGIIVINAGPVGWWKLDEGTAEEIQDSSTFGIAGIINSPETNVWDAPTKSLKLDGTYTHGLVPGGSTPPPHFNLTRASGFTQQFWINVSSSLTADNYYGIMGYEESGELERLPSVYVHKGRIHAGFSGRDFTSANGAISALKWCNITTDAAPITQNQWTHISVLYDKISSTYTVYKNGVKIEDQAPKYQGRDCVQAWPREQATNEQVPLRLRRFNIGKVEDGTNLAGMIAEVKLYNYPRSAGQIQADFNSTKKRFGL